MQTSLRPNRIRTSDRGLLALLRHEGVVPAPYRDVKGVWTFGIGHTAEAGPPDPAAMARGMPADPAAGIAQAFRLFRADLRRHEAEVLRAVKVPLAPHEFDALVSFHFNTGGIARAALTRHLNASDRAAAAEAFMGWLRPASLRERRAAERDLFRQGRYPEGPIPVWAADAAGRVDFSRPVRRLGEAEALALLWPAAPDGKPGRGPDGESEALPIPKPVPVQRPRELPPSASGPALAAAPAPPAPAQPGLLGRLAAVLAAALARR
jgi:lysozyme